MAFTLPTFNMDVDFSNEFLAPFSGPTWRGPLTCQKYTGYKVRNYNTPQSTVWYPHLVQFRFEPVGFYAWFDRADIPNWTIAFLQVPTGAGIFYRVVNWEIQNYGFSNEYPFFTAYLCYPTDGMPIPPASANNNGFAGGWPYLMGPVP